MLPPTAEIIDIIATIIAAMIMIHLVSLDFQKISFKILLYNKSFDFIFIPVLSARLYS